jgi:hypothetical protein
MVMGQLLPAYLTVRTATQTPFFATLPIRTSPSMALTVFVLPISISTMVAASLVPASFQAAPTASPIPSLPQLSAQPATPMDTSMHRSTPSPHAPPAHRCASLATVSPIAPCASTTSSLVPEYVPALLTALCTMTLPLNRALPVIWSYSTVKPALRMELQL